MTNDFDLDEVEPEESFIDPTAPDDDAPYGYMIDRTTGERRPKLRPGRPTVISLDEEKAPTLSPTLDELKSSSKAGSVSEDRAPSLKTKQTRRGRSNKAKTPEAVPAFRAGPIAKGMNALYAKVGKIVRVMDSDVGAAIIATTRKENEEDVTVGEAWEELAKVNPRIRAVLLRLITGGAYGQLFMAHLPILLAIMMKESIRKHIPFMKLVQAMGSDDDGPTSSPEETFFGGMSQEDMQQMMGMAQGLMANMPRMQDNPPRMGEGSAA